MMWKPGCQVWIYGFWMWACKRAALLTLGNWERENLILGVDGGLQIGKAILKTGKGQAVWWNF